MADAIQNTYLRKLLEGVIDHANDTFKVMLLDSNHSQDKDNYEFIDEVNVNEISGTGYTAGGETLANLSVTVDDANDKGVFDADDVQWTSATFTARYAVVYKDTGTPSTSPILLIYDFGSDVSPTNGTLTIQFNASGIVNTVNTT